jgi:hypothetical protein
MRQYLENPFSELSNSTKFPKKEIQYLLKKEIKLVTTFMTCHIAVKNLH